MRSLLSCVTLLLAGSVCFAAQPKVSISYATFRGAETPYVELSLNVERASLTPTSDGTLAADLTILFSNEDGVIKQADKVRLMAPADDSSRVFIEALRYALPNGSYTLSVEATDAGDEVQLPLKLKTQVSLDYPATETRLSDIQLVADRRPVDETNDASGLVKNGFVFEPLAANFVRRQMSGFSAYVEAYTPSSTAAEPRVLEYKILKLNGADEEATELVRKTKRFETSDGPIPFFIGVSTARLPSGQYAIQMDVRDRSLQSLHAKSTLFTVSNPAQDVRRLSERAEGIETSFAAQIPDDSLEYVLRAVLPTLPNNESEYVSSILNQGNPEAMRLAVYNHFVGESATVPGAAYNAFMKVAKEVDVAFRSGFGYGFQTDRGHIYLKYGQPDDRVVVNDDPSAPPYEIWVYNFVELTQQSPGKFLFMNDVLDNASYTIIHSTVRGELFDPRWKRVLYSRSSDEFLDDDTTQGTDIADNVGRYADEYFDDF